MAIPWKCEREDGVMAGARQLRLGQILRDLRIKAGFDQQAAAERVGRNRSSVGHWESARSRPGRSDLDVLLTFYGVDDDTRERIQQLRADSGKGGWWTLYQLPAWFTPYVGFEADAIEGFNFETNVVPGLLQTRAYARAIHESGRMTLDSASIDEWVEARMQRQQRLAEEHPLVLNVVIAEEAFHRVIGGHEVMAEQIRALIDASRRPNVDLRVVPLDAGGHPALPGGFMLLRFEQHADVVFVDTALSGHIVDNPAETAEFGRVFSVLQNIALSADETTTLLATLAGKYSEV
ncbi:helix-turn-helix domain-containing protein [Saccharopolyspora sp. MS10]|uniref:helix-turn-helix domain-containing protein n=1 Tax=Saccharopolyspora sp. MS10 TaxID=3385973 RepID=UPI0039A2D2FD